MFIIKMICRILISALSILQFAMVIRAILLWFPQAPSNKFFDILYYITDLAVMPVRRFMTRFNLVSNIPIDLSFLITFILISVIQRTLYYIF